MWDLIVSVPDHCLSFYFEKANIKFLKTDVKWINCRWKLKSMTIEIHSYTH